MKLLHDLLDRLHEAMHWDEDRFYEGTTAAEAFTLKHGIAQDFAHVFITASRSLGVPARFVAGYYCGEPENGRAAGHAWAEAFVPDLGWVAFDAANGMCATDAHARVAVGLDHLGAAAVRGMRYGGGAETLTVDIRVDQASRQTQS